MWPRSAAWQEQVVRPIAQTATVSSTPRQDVAGTVEAPPAEAVKSSAATAAASSAKSPTAARRTLSELLARILDQLSVSAWLPAGVLVALLLLLGNLHAHDNHLGTALKRIGDLELNTIILLVGAVVITTVVTQAFEFEAIRLLEGYWGAGVVATALGGLSCRRHLRRRVRLDERRKRLERELFPQVRHLMLERGVDQAVVNVIEAKQTGQGATGSDADREKARHIWWMDHAAPHQRRRYDALVNALNEFPPEQLTLPTRLGNVLRSVEAPLMHRDAGPLEGRLMKIYDQLPAVVRYEHDQYRGRLDLYCSLVLVFIAVGISSVPILATTDTGPTTSAALIAVGVSAVAVWLSYRAAIASARKYGLVIKTITANFDLR